MELKKSDPKLIENYVNECEKDPIFFIRNFLGINLSVAQEQMINSIQKNKLTVGLFSRQCLVSGTLVTMADGTVKPIEEIKQGDKVLSLNTETFKYENDIVNHVWKTEPKDVYNISVSKINKIRCSSKHQFLTLKNTWSSIDTGLTRAIPSSVTSSKFWRAYDKKEPWKTAFNFLATINLSDIHSKDRLSIDEARFLGYFMADGSYTKGQAMKFTNITERYLNEVSELSTRLFPSTSIKSYIKGKGKDLIFIGKNTYKDSHHPHDASLFVRKHGLFHIHGPQKRVPIDVFLSSDKIKGEFLNRLWAADGCVYVSKVKGHAVELFVGAESELQGRDFISLLRSIGVQSYMKLSMGKKSTRPFWKVMISKNDNISRFFDKVGLIFGKEIKSLEAMRIAKEKRNVWVSKRYRGDIFYEGINKIIKEEKQEIMYDLEVEKNHNFIANGFIVHNSGKSTAVSAYVVWRLMYGKGTTINGLHMDEEIVVASPSYPQSKLIYERIRKLIRSNELIRAHIAGEMTLEKIRVNNGNVCRMVSASVSAEIRGLSPTIICVDECQDVDDTVMNSVILPMLTTTKGALVKIGTPKTRGQFYNSAYEDPTASVIIQPYNKCSFYTEQDIKEIEAKRSDRGGSMPIPLWLQEYNCFVGETLVDMKNGQKSIMNIKEGEEVLTHKRRYRPVLKTSKRHYEGNMQQITLGYSNVPLTVTPEHRFLIAQLKNYHKWVVAKDLKPGMLVLYPRNKEHYSKTKILLSDYFDIKTHLNKLGLFASKNRLHKRKNIIINKKFMRFLGYYIAEGCIGADKRTVDFSFNINEEHLHSDVQCIGRELFGLDAKFYPKPEESVMKIDFHSSVLAEVLSNLVGDGAENKCLPNWMLTLHSRLQKAFLDAYWEGDGCHYQDKTRNLWRASTVSSKLAYQIKILLMRQGLFPSLRIYQPEPFSMYNKKTKTYRICPTKLRYEISYNKNTKYKEHLSRDYFAFPIRKNKVIPFCGDVYNLEVKEDNTYVVGCVTHNCEFLDMSTSALPAEIVKPNLMSYTYTTEESNYITPAANSGDYVIGVDLAREKDSTVITVIRKDQLPYKIVHTEAHVHLAYTALMGRLKVLVDHFQPSSVNVDQTGEKGWGDLANALGISINPIVFNLTEKENMIANLRVLFEKGLLKIPTENELLYSQIIHQQFETTMYGRKQFYHPTDEHDDRLWSLCLCAMALNIDVTDFNELAPLQDVGIEAKIDFGYDPFKGSQKERDASLIKKFKEEYNRANNADDNSDSMSTGDTVHTTQSNGKEDYA